MRWQENYEKWKNKTDLGADLKADLATKAINEKLLEDSFYRDMEFGTAGMRGVIGAGTNRMNIYTVRKATSGLAAFIETGGEVAKARGVAIAYDSRHMSREFAFESAAVLGARGIKSYVFESLRPTPELSFAVRYLNCFSGIVITASHNPPEYNGYKIYGEDGGQMPPEAANMVTKYIDEVEDIFTIPVATIADLKAAKLLEIISEKVDTPYLNRVKEVIVDKSLVAEKGHTLKIVFTPLHGTGGILGVPALNSVGFTTIIKVEEQFEPDPDFKTVKSPNPENREAFLEAIAYGEKYDADILVGTDPDADRLGVCVRNKKGHYEVLTGNQIGALILNHLLGQKKAQHSLPTNAAVLKSIVTSDLGKDIADYYDVEMIEVLTGFKFIAEKIKAFEVDHSHQFEFGYEESNGYMVKSFTRDKDAIQAVLAICEVALASKENGHNLAEELEALFEKFGYYREGLISKTMDGKDGSEQIKTIMREFRKELPTEIGGEKLARIDDYLVQTTTLLENGEQKPISLPKADVLKCFFKDGSWIALRPSGTEPKIKFYFSVKAKSELASITRLEKVQVALLEKLGLNN